jgi:tRNA uridine 5-carbamoylmethylation protein Kti12
MIRNKKKLSTPYPIIIISGAPGVGKTSLIKKLTTKYKTSAHISVDQIRNFIKAGYESPNNLNRKVNFQYKLARENAAFIAKNLQNNGFVVFVDDVFRNDWRNEFIELVKTKKVLFFYLTAKLKTIQIRNENRAEFVVPSDIVKKNYYELEKQNTKENSWIVINTDSLSTEEISKLPELKLK